MRVLLNGGVNSVLATIISLEIFYVLAAIYLAMDAQSSAGRALGLFALPMYFVSLQTYGLSPLLRFPPYSFGFGMLIAAYLAKSQWQVKFSSLSAWDIRLAPKLSIWLGFMGLLALGEPVASVILCVLALVAAGSAARKSARDSGASRTLATVGILFATLILAIIGAVYLLEARGFRFE